MTPRPRPRFLAPAWRQAVVVARGWDLHLAVAVIVAVAALGLLAPDLIVLPTLTSRTVALTPTGAMAAVAASIGVLLAAREPLDVIPSTSPRRDNAGETLSPSDRAVGASTHPAWGPGVRGSGGRGLVTGQRRRRPDAGASDLGSPDWRWLTAHEPDHGSAGLLRMRWVVDTRVHELPHLLPEHPVHPRQRRERCG